MDACIGSDRFCLNPVQLLKTDNPFFYNGSANIFMEKGDYRAAIDAYEKFISLADKKNDEHFIQRAQEKIQECQLKLQEK